MPQSELTVDGLIEFLDGLTPAERERVNEALRPNWPAAHLPGPGEPGTTLENRVFSLIYADEYLRRAAFGPPRPSPFARGPAEPHPATEIEWSAVVEHWYYRNVPPAVMAEIRRRMVEAGHLE